MVRIKYKLNGRKCSLKVKDNLASEIISTLILNGVKVTTVISK